LIRPATVEDLDDLVRLARAFTGESGLPLTFNAERAQTTLWNALHHPDMDCIVEWDGAITGLAIVVYEAEYYDETCAYVDKFFVHKELRGRGTSDALVRGILAACSGRGATCIFASATAGMGERVEKLYVRLFERHGFSVLGRVVMRNLR
jgi:GNAT superfamily N-acetyltransferase